MNKLKRFLTSKKTTLVAVASGAALVSFDSSFITALGDLGVGTAVTAKIVAAAKLGSLILASQPELIRTRAAELAARLRRWAGIAARFDTCIESSAASIQRPRALSRAWAANSVPVPIGLVRISASPGRSARRLSSSRLSASVSAGDPNAWAASAPSSARCSGDIEWVAPTSVEVPLHRCARTTTSP